MLGKTFANYAIAEHLKRGGMSDIFLVYDQQHRPFILRVLLDEFRFRWTYRRRFKSGCEIARQLNHPNIVRCFETGRFDGQRYCILEYVEGANLKELILRGDPLVGEHWKRLLLGMAAGLAHIHERGFLHLDFKPENIVVTRDGDPKILDFDLAIPRPSRPRRVAKLSGTPSYLAPEQITRQPVDERADVFAFGITAYETITGKKPITGDSQDEVMRKYADFNQHLKPLRTHVPQLPAAVDRVILKCLEKDISRRYPSMSLVVRDLQS